MTTERLADAITLVASDQEMQQRAAELGTQIRAEGGITRASEFIHRHLSDDSR